VAVGAGLGREHLRLAEVHEQASLIGSGDAQSNRVHHGNINVNQPSNQRQSAYGKVGRNDLCPCGSGKKYKRCHGA